MPASAQDGGPAVVDAGLPAPAAGVFTERAGGASSGPYAEGNLALHVGDDRARVLANRAALARRLGVGPDRLAFGEQVHGAGVARVTGGTGERGVPGVDALVTVEPGTVLVMMAADCLPVLLADPQAGVVAAAHAGRQGLAAGVLQAALAAMAELGAQAGRTTAVLGPSVCGRCYEVPADLADEVERTVPGSRATTRRGTPAVDLAAGARALLEGAGVARVAQTGGCTLEQPDRLYSHRRDGTTGRHAGAVWLAGPR